MNVDKTEIVRAENILRPAVYFTKSFFGIRRSVLAMTNKEGLLFFEFYDN